MVEAALSTTSMRKFQAAGAYLAAMLSGRLPRRSTRRTPDLTATTSPPPAVGAAATLVTSDEELVAQVLASRSQRHAGSRWWRCWESERGAAPQLPRAAVAGDLRHGYP